MEKKRQTSHDIMRERLLKQSGVTKTTLADLCKTQWSPRFEMLMRNRLLMGYFRYEPFEAKRKKMEYDCAAEAIKRIKQFQKTGNTEKLVDAANMCLIEFEFTRHPKKHFKSEDDGEHAKKLDT